MKKVVFRNRKFLYSSIIALLVIAGILAKSYIDQKSANRALRAKIISLYKERRISKSWKDILGVPIVAQKDKEVSKQQNPVASGSFSTTVKNQEAVAADPILTNLSTQELAMQLSVSMIEVKSLTKADLEQTILIADEIILREPSSYTAYKAKLISLLVKEGKFKEEIENIQVDELLETMASFNTQRKENVISKAEVEQSKLGSKVTELYAEIEENYRILQTIDKNSPEAVELELRQEDISNQYKEANDTYMANDNELEEVLYGKDNINRDLVEIPFLRMLAKNDYDGVIDNAQDFIDEFPNSTDGYFYMAQAYEKQGMHDRAQSVVRETNLNSQSLNALNKRLQNSIKENSQNYWQGLNF